MMTMEKAPETVECAPDAHFVEPSAAIGVEEIVEHRRVDKSGASSERGAPHEARPAKKSGRPPARWRIRVVRVDAAKHPEFPRLSTNPFATMAVQARVAEIDAFCARLWARTKKKAA